jgi:hypothetical protein
MTTATVTNATKCSLWSILPTDDVCAACRTARVPCLFRYAVASRGWLTFQGRWAWWLKDYVDKAFMNRYGKDLHMDDGGAEAAVCEDTAGS